MAGWPCADGAARRSGRGVNGEAVAHQKLAVYPVFQLANVAGPRVLANPGERGGIESLDRHAVFGAKDADEMLRQLLGIAGTITQRR